MPSYDRLTINVDGIPGPQGSKAFKGFTSTGKARLVESSKKVKPWRRAVFDAAVLAMESSNWKAELIEAYSVSFTFWLPRPASAPKTKRIQPIRYPDDSKLIRSTEDALTKAGVWKDDARIVWESGSKKYAVPREEWPKIWMPSDHEKPGALIVVTKLPYYEEVEVAFHSGT